MTKQSLSLHYFANPAVFLRLSRALLPAVWLLALLTLALGLHGALLASPPDYQQGEAVRIMYIHVPAAWLATMLYGGIVLLSIAYLIWKHALASVIAREIAPIGAVFTLITLITGALWGKPMWGAYWVWDARLTSVAILFFIYLGYMMTAGNEGEENTRSGAAWLAIVGGVNLPIIKFSVEWFNTLHQPASLLRADGPSIDPAMLTPLLLCMAGFMLLAVALLLVRVEAALNEQKWRALQRRVLRARQKEGENAA